MFREPLPLPTMRSELRSPLFRRSWTSRELLDSLGSHPVRALDVGAGRHPLRLRDIDTVVSVDFDASSQPTVVIDFTCDWPFGDSEFDLIYLSHVVEHLYPRDRDQTIRNVYRSTKPGGFVMIRVPHRSSVQATGWEHFTVYGLNGVTSLFHGFNPQLPMFRPVSIGVALSIDFHRTRSVGQLLLERGLNYKFRLTDQILAKLIGGVAEVQFLLQRLPEDVEMTLRMDTTSGTAN